MTPLPWPLVHLPSEGTFQQADLKEEPPRPWPCSAASLESQIPPWGSEAPSRCPHSRSADTHSGRQPSFLGQFWVRDRDEPLPQSCELSKSEDTTQCTASVLPPSGGACNCVGLGFALRRPMGQRRLKPLGQRLPVGQRESLPGWEPALDAPLTHALLVLLFRKPGLRWGLSLWN